MLEVLIVVILCRKRMHIWQSSSPLCITMADMQTLQYSLIADCDFNIEWVHFLIPFCFSGEAEGVLNFVTYVTCKTYSFSNLLDNLYSSWCQTIKLRKNSFPRDNVFGKYSVRFIGFYGWSE